ncbi:MAG: hypothetical protein GY759_03255, partial [Chloroflexi bacterium]|nr:hypothetical protein [Chloroflexota bacterium]
MLQSRRLILFALSLLVTLAISGGLVLALNSTGEPTAEATIIAALERARALDSYHVVADSRQNLIPLPTAANIGQGDQTSSVRVLGDISQGAQIDGSADLRARLQVQADAAADPVEFVLADGGAYMGYQGRWQQIEEQPGSVAPAGDYLSYLDAIKNVVEIEAANTAEGMYRRFAFELDGERYAQFQLQQMEQDMAGRLPQGVQLKPSPALQNMVGKGELWLDESGLPRRQILDINMPAVSENFDARVDMVIDYSRFGQPIPGIEIPQPVGENGALVMPDSNSDSALTDNQSPTVMTTLTQSLKPVSSGLIPGLIALPLLVLALLLIKRPRALYMAVASTMVVLMVVQPLLQVGQFALFEQHSAEAAPVDEALQSMGLLPPERPAADDNASLHSESNRLAATTTLQDCRTLYVNAGSQASGDDDGDGLSNEVEWCLGTDYNDVDTDGDFITDTVELEGFTLANETWRSDPMNSDSNGDGVDDGLEWEPILTSDTYTGADSFTDYDNDGVPNLWDADNDDDGVPDDQDISPYEVTAYRPSFDLAVTSHATDTTVYVDIHVQPEITTHLRYGLTTLDWPSDDKGQIQDRDASTDDITLIPVLTIASTISPSLASEYAMVSSPVSSTDLSQGYNLWVPLQPVAAAGNIYAFSARLAFISSEADSGINLTGGKILWLAKAALDSCVASDTDSCASVTTEDSVVATYFDGSIRVSGLNVSEYKNVQVGLFGTSSPEVSADPAVADEDKVMFTLMAAGLGGSFLHYVNPDLDQIETNFSDETAQSPYTKTWGIDPSIMYVDVNTYSHRDLALASTTQTNTAQFLDSNYITCTVNTTAQYTPTIASAYQETTGSMNSSDPRATITNADPSVTSSAPLQFSLPLGEASTYTWRQVQMTSYGCSAEGNGGATWATLTETEAIYELDRRYPDVADASWLGMVQRLFLFYYIGVGNKIMVNGSVNYSADETAPEDAFSTFIDNSETSMPSYVRKVYDIDSLYLDVNTVGLGDALRDWAKDLSGRANLYIGLDIAGQYVSVILRSVTKAMVHSSQHGIAVMEEIDRIAPRGAESAGFPEIFDGKAHVKFFGDKVEYRDEWQELEFTDEEATSIIARADRTARITSGIYAGAVATIITGILIATTWLGYNGSTKDLNNVQKDMGYVQAWVSTYLLVFQLILTLILIIIDSFFVWWSSIMTTTGVGIIVEAVVIIILYIIVGAYSGDWNPLNTQSHLVEWWADDIEDFKMYVSVPQGGVSTGGLSLNINPTSTVTNGPLNGAWFQISTTISTTVAISHSGSSSDVADSWALTRWQKGEQPFYLEYYGVSSSPVYSSALSTSTRTANAKTHCDTTVGDDDAKDCYANSVVQFQSASAGRNAAIPIVSTLEAYLTYYICKPFHGCGTNMNYSYSGDDSDLQNTVASNFYLDILPETLDLLFNWDARDPYSKTTYANFNVDKDSDELSDKEETTLGTDATLWDTDGDELSDGWENDNSSEGVDPTLSDSDGDGLDDRTEIVLGTAPDTSDTDGDGLSDGEEYCRVSSGQLVGGWFVTDAGGHWVCSSPLHADYDGDGLLDSQEKQDHLSPYAPNTAPGLRVLPDPSVKHNSAAVTVLRAGDPLTLTVLLNNTTSERIDEPFTLTYASSILPNMTVVTQTGSTGYTPPTPVITTQDVSWDFSANPLSAAENMTSTLLTGADSGLTQSQVTTLTATLIYTDVNANAQKSLTQTVQVLVDEDVPSSLVTTPGDGDAINGSSYVAGGTASDPTSWPETIELRVTGDNSYDSDWQTATDTAPWAWTWTPLPADGVYTMQSQATDYVGNMESPGSGVSFIVDNTPPGASFS